MSTLLTVSEVADRIRVPEATLRFWRHGGVQGPRSFKVGRRVMYRAEDVDSWLNEQYEASAPKPVA